MDRQRLAQRNQRLARARHRRSHKQILRDRALQAIASLPIRRAKQPANAAERILIIQPDHIGDGILCLPALQALKRAQPQLQLHMLCGTWTAALWAEIPEVAELQTLPFPGFEREGGPRANPLHLAWQTARQLRAGGYSCALLLRPGHWWGALVAFWAGIPQRIGYGLSGVAPLLTDAYPHVQEHALMQKLRLVSHWTGSIDPSRVQLRFPVSDGARAALVQLLNTLPAAAPHRIICLHPGSGAAIKGWLPDKWAAVADSLLQTYPATLLLTGSASEAAITSAIQAKMRGKALCLAGQTSLPLLAALYDRAQLIIGTDSGALHLAAAVGSPTVTLFGPADPAEFAPWGEAGRHAVVSSAIACQPCRILGWQQDDAALHPCVHDIMPQQVLAAVRKVLAASAAP